jgi:4-hydroxy-3-polyprenylbenzoate decarboxylase
MAKMDFRDFIRTCEEEGELLRIKANVDWELELSHIASLNERKQGPALLFERVKDYSIPVFTGAFTTPKRMAIALDMPLNYSICDLAKEWMKITTKKLIPPQTVNSGPVLENVIDEGEVNLFNFPAPKFYPLDGGRYIGTAASLITKDPESGWVNMGNYRMQLLDEKHAGANITKGKHADFMLKKYKAMKKPMPAAAVIGCDPLQLLVASTLVSVEVSEYDLVGALRGEPVEVITSDLTGLPIPAFAEIVLEGEIDPEKLRNEGPFGEFTGYYSSNPGEAIPPKPCLEVKRILHRNNPIFWAIIVGRPVADTHMIQSLARTATLWSDLENMRIPGIESVYILPESGGRFWVIVSVKQMYPGHSNQVAHAVIGTTTGHYGIKGIIVVDDDIRADDLERVWWALAVRYNPLRGTEIVKRGRSSAFDPALQRGEKQIGSRIILDATIPFEWEERQIEVKLSEEMVEKVRKRWNEYGFDD